MKHLPPLVARGCLAARAWIDVGFAPTSPRVPGGGPHMNEIVGRWRTGDGHWHEGWCFEILLEKTTSGWAVSYFEHGELHARIGFDNHDEARGDVGYLMSKISAESDPWQRAE